MSVSGLYGFRKDGIDKVTYNHCDSCPSGLGAKVVQFIQQTDTDDLIKLYDKIQMVSEDGIPTEQQINDCIENGYADFNVSTRSKQDWYCLLRNMQGNFDALISLEKKDRPLYMIDSHSFIKDSLFCEYAYIIDLDKKELEFYIGFQRIPDDNNRYGTEKEYNYYPCKCIKTFKLDDIKGKDVSDIIEEMEQADEENSEIGVQDFIYDVYGDTVEPMSLEQFEDYKETKGIEEWDYPLEEYEHITENHIECKLVCFTEDNGYSYRFCELPS